MATRDKEGWRLDGTVGYCSGIPYSTHFLGQAVPEGERLARTRKTSLPPPMPRRTDPDYQRWLGAADVQLATAEAALLRCAQTHRELCERAVSGGAPFGYEDDYRIAAIAREVIVQAWETAERNIFRSAGARVMVKGARMERLYRDLSMIASHRNTVFRDPVHRLFGQMRLNDD